MITDRAKLITAWLFLSLDSNVGFGLKTKGGCSNVVEWRRKTSIYTNTHSLIRLHNYSASIVYRRERKDHQAKGLERRGISTWYETASMMFDHSNDDFLSLYFDRLRERRVKVHHNHERPRSQQCVNPLCTYIREASNRFLRRDI